MRCEPHPRLNSEQANHMKKLLLTTLVFVAASLSADEAKSSYSISTDFTFVSEYIFRGVKQQSASFQPSVTITSGGFTAGVWTAQALEDRAATWADGNEIDIFASYEMAITDAYAFTVGATSYQYPHARPLLGELDSTFELSAGISGPLGPLSGSLTYFRDFDLDANVYELGLSYGADVNDKTSYEVGGSYGIARYDAGGDYDYYALKATVSYKLSEKTALTVGAYWSDTDITGLKSNTWFSVGFSADL